MKDFLLIGVDVGNRFTDAIVISPYQIKTVKLPSQPTDPSQAVLAALEALDISTSPDQLLHSTTLVTDMLREQKGVPTGLITSSDFYTFSRPIFPRDLSPVPPKWQLTVPERIDEKGTIVTPLDEAAVRKAAKQLTEAGIEAVAIGFLYAYQFPRHEELARQWVQEMAPDLFVCISSEVSTRFRAYERLMTAIWNARVAPIVHRYLHRLTTGLSQRWPNISLTMMTSNGGVEEIEQGTKLFQTPIRLALSSAAAAGQAMIRVAYDLHLSDSIGLDVGATNTNIMLIQSGKLKDVPLEERRIGDYPLQIPMLDLHPLQLGGESLLFRDEAGRLQIDSSSPEQHFGPACYGQGGIQPTLTDAAFITGRLPPDLILGKDTSLHLSAAKTSFATLDSQSVPVALEALTLAETQIASAVQKKAVHRNIDIQSDIILIAGGGMGPTLACGVADKLGLSEVVIPPYPGLLAAWGLLTAPDRRESLITILRPLEEISQQMLLDLRRQVIIKLPLPPAQVAQLSYICTLRYVGETSEIKIALTAEDTTKTLAQQFHTAYEQVYGSADATQSIEWATLQAYWEITPQSWRFLPLPPQNMPAKNHTVWEWDTAQDPPKPKQQQAQIYHRSDLAPSTFINGPALILEESATIYVPPGWLAHPVKDGYLKIEKDYPHHVE